MKLEIFVSKPTLKQAHARWIGEDTVEISYPQNARVAQKRTWSQYGSEHVTVRYVVLGDSVK